MHNRLTTSFEEANTFRTSYYPQQLPQTMAIATAIFETIVSDGRVFVYGHGVCSFLSDMAVSYGLGCFQTDRIPLPMISLQANSTILHVAHTQYGIHHSLARQLDALGTSHDVLFTFDIGTDPEGVQELIETAHRKEMRILCISSETHSTLDQLLRPELDVKLILPSAVSARLLEEYLFLLHQIMDAVDAQLLGEL